MSKPKYVVLLENNQEIRRKVIEFLVKYVGKTHEIDVRDYKKNTTTTIESLKKLGDFDMIIMIDSSVHTVQLLDSLVDTRALNQQGFCAIRHDITVYEKFKDITHTTVGTPVESTFPLISKAYKMDKSGKKYIVDIGDYSVVSSRLDRLATFLHKTLIPT